MTPEHDDDGVEILRRGYPAILLELAKRERSEDEQHLLDYVEGLEFALRFDEDQIGYLRDLAGQIDVLAAGSYKIEEGQVLEALYRLKDDVQRNFEEIIHEGEPGLTHPSRRIQRRLDVTSALARGTAPEQVALELDESLSYVQYVQRRWAS